MGRRSQGGGRGCGAEKGRAYSSYGRVDRSGFVTDDWIFLWLLLVIAVTGYLIEGFRIAEDMPEFERWSPVGWALAKASRGMMGAEALVSAHVWSWWIHALLVMLFIAYIPFSKMMHIFTDVLNLVFTDERAAIRLPALPPGPAPSGGAGGSKRPRSS